MSLTREELENSLSNLYHVLEHPCDGCSHNRTEFCNHCNVKQDLSNMRKLIHEHFAHEHTECFKHFKLYSDSVLKSSNKQDLIDYLHMIYHNWSVTDGRLINVINYASDLQSKYDSREENQLTVEEIEVIEECAKHNNNYCSVKGAHCSMTYYDEKYCCEAVRNVFKKLQKQKEMLKND